MPFYNSTNIYSYTVTSTANIFVNIPTETFKTNIVLYEEIDVFPFKVRHKIEETVGSIDYYSKRSTYDVLEGDRYIKYFSNKEPLSIECLEAELSELGQKWLNKEMLSTMKVD